MSEITQKDKVEALKNDRDTFFDRAQSQAGEEMGGRFKRFSKTVVIGAGGPPQYPKMPEGNPWKETADTGQQAPFGVDHSKADIE
jgi:hypothetical protein